MPRAQIPAPASSRRARGMLAPQAAPSNPPNTMDIVQGIQKSRQSLNHYNIRNVEAEDIVKAEVYKNKILYSQDVIEPPWFAAARQDIRTMKEDMQTIKRDIRTMKRDMQTMQETQVHIWKLAARQSNIHAAGTGADATYDVVPFLNGDDPTKPPHNLPALMKPRHVRQLTRAQQAAYFRGYYGDDDDVPPAVQCKGKIYVAIGHVE